MAANTGERTLIPALIPPRAAHVDGIYSLAVPGSLHTLVEVTGSMCSLISDFAVRVAPKSTIRSGTASRLPQGFSNRTRQELILRVLRLNCVSDAYSEIWEQCFDEAFRADRWTEGSAGELLRAEVGDAIGPTWSSETPLRGAAERRQALLEIDALVALSLGVTADELCTIYRTQFPVLYGYDTRSSYYDANGRIVPSSILAMWRRRGMNDGEFADCELAEEHSGSGIAYRYVMPFTPLDREHDLRVAYAEFERRSLIRP